MWIEESLAYMDGFKIISISKEGFNNRFKTIRKLRKTLQWNSVCKFKLGERGKWKEHPGFILTSDGVIKRMARADTFRCLGFGQARKIEYKHILKEKLHKSQIFSKNTYCKQKTEQDHCKLHCSQIRSSYFHLSNLVLSFNFITFHCQRTQNKTRCFSRQGYRKSVRNVKIKYFHNESSVSLMCKQ